MQLRRSISVIFFLITALPLWMSGQNNQASHKVNIEIPEVALLGLVAEESGNVKMVADAPDEAGAPVSLTEIQQNNGIWINYSSIIRNQNHRRKVVATVQGEMPPGMRLLVEASEARGKGNGMLGKSLGKVYLSGESTEVISDVGSCYTGKGAGNGHYLAYRLETDTKNEMFAGHMQNQTTVQVIYTLTDNN